MSERRQLRSQRLRQVNFQGDALRLGMNWTVEDLGKPQVLIDSAYGMGHPGTFHFRPLIEEVSNGVFEAGGKPGVFTVSDICDGTAQAHTGMTYSLVSRDIMAAMVETHAPAHPHAGIGRAPVELFPQHPEAHRVCFRATRVDGTELTDPHRDVVFEHVFAALEELVLQRLAIDVLAAAHARVGPGVHEARQRVVVVGVDHVG